VESLFGGEQPAVKVMENGQPDPGQMDVVRHYYEVLVAAKAAIAKDLPGRRWKSADRDPQGHGSRAVQGATPVPARDGR